MYPFRSIFTFQQLRPGNGGIRTGLRVILGLLALTAIVSTAVESQASIQDSTVSIIGNVYYFENGGVVDKVTVILSGQAGDTMTTGTDGRFLFGRLPSGGEYALSPARHQDFSSISAYDASIILQHVFQRLPLTEYQYLAADVTRDEILSTLDATAILKYIVFLGPKYFVTADNSIGHWGFDPSGRQYESLAVDLTDQNFIAYVRGDLTGNWREPTIPLDTIYAWHRWSCPLPGQSFSFTLSLENVRGTEVFAFQCLLRYDRTVLTVDDLYIPWSGGYNYDMDDGLISLAWAGDIPRIESGDALTITFQVSPRAETGQTISIDMDTFLINEGSPWVQVADADIPIIPVPDISVSPTSCRFGQVGIGRPHEMVLTLFNNGLEDLVIFDIQVPGPSFTVDKTSCTIPPGRSDEVTVTFTPLSKDHYFTRLTILSNDPDESHIDISLTGQGVYARPDIDISDGEFAFGKVAVQGAVSRLVTVTNIGNDELIISNIESNNPEFIVSQTGFLLTPQQSRGFTVTCTPASTGSTSATVTITSNDPDEAITELYFQAVAVSPEATLFITNGSGYPGTSDNLVSVYLENGMKIGGVELVLSFDSNVLKATEVSRTSRSASMGLFGADLKYQSGEVKVLIVDLKRKSISEGAGSVADFRFAIDEEAPQGVYPVTLTQALVADTDGRPIMTTVQASRFLVVGASERTWRVNLTAVSLDADEHPIFVSFGVDPEGTSGFDPDLDVPQAPRLLDAEFNVYFSIDHELIDRLYTDFKRPEEGIMWTIVTQGKGGIVSWNHTDLPSSGQFIISTSSLFMVSMREEEAVLFNAGDTIRIEYGQTVSVQGDNPALLPEQCALNQNCPNPFNPTTAISYQLSAVSEQTTGHSPLITLKVYNLLGQEVTTLVDEVQEPGYYTVSWDGVDSGGNPVASGIYFYRLSRENDRMTETKPMVLMK